MKTYIVLNNNKKSILLKDGFAFIAAFLNPAWLLLHGLFVQFLYITSLIVITATFYVHEYIQLEMFAFIYLTFSLIVGLKFSFWYSKKLNKHGFEKMEIVVAKNEDEAMLRYYDKIALNTNQDS